MSLEEKNFFRYFHNDFETSHWSRDNDKIKFENKFKVLQFLKYIINIF